jgi:hypothetical protein
LGRAGAATRVLVFVVAAVLISDWRYGGYSSGRYGLNSYNRYGSWFFN